MRNIILAVTLMTTVACVKSPTQPSTSEAPATHNISAVAQDGHIVWVCATQPRQYGAGWEIDHYIADNPCPVVPIP